MERRQRRNDHLLSPGRRISCNAYSARRTEAQRPWMRRRLMSHSYRHLRLFWLAALAAMLFTSAVNATTYSITSIATRTGVTVPVMIIDKSADTPPAVGTLIMFTGGNGQLNLLTHWPTDQSGLQTHDTDSSANFLVRQRNNFADAGPFNIILMDVPSDQSSGYST